MIQSCSHKRGFTLAELLVVIAVTAIITAISVPAIFSMTSSSKMNQMTSELSGLLEQARQYAVAQDTFVWVAFSTQTVNNVDTVTVAVVASTDGSDPGTFGVSPAPNFAVPSSSLTLVSKVRSFPQLQLQTPGSYGFSAPASLPATPVTGTANALSSNASFSVQIPGAAGTTSFTQFVEFTPSGQARNSSSPIDIIEFALDPAQTHSVPNPNNGAVVQLNGLTGQNLVYRK